MSTKPAEVDAQVSSELTESEVKPMDSDELEINDSESSESESEIGTEEDEENWKDLSPRQALLVYAIEEGAGLESVNWDNVKDKINRKFLQRSETAKSVKTEVLRMMTEVNEASVEFTLATVPVDVCRAIAASYKASEAQEAQEAGAAKDAENVAK